MTLLYIHCHSKVWSQKDLFFNYSFY